MINAQEIESIQRDIDALREKVENLKKTNHSPNLGDHYRNTISGNIYVVHRTEDDKYHLINVTTGSWWRPPVRELKDIFYSLGKTFEKVDLIITVIK